MHLSNSVLWNNSQNENTSNIDEKKQIIKGVVFWIISKSLSQTHKNYCSKRYKNKHFSKGTDSFINWLKKDILNWSTWKLFERILIEEILLQNFWTLTSLEHDDNWIDLIVKSWNIKIWTDTTMNSIPEKISIKEKTLKLRNLEIDIYNKNLTNLFEWSVSQQPDLCWLLEFRGIEQYKKIIINCFNNWLKNWFENNWYDYLTGNKNIKKLISDVISADFPNLFTGYFSTSLWLTNEFLSFSIYIVPGAIEFTKISGASLRDNNSVNFITPAFEIP